MHRILAHATPRNVVVWSVLDTELAARAALRPAPLSIVDVGGGTGGMAVPLAEAGHHVTVVDTSPNALAGLTRRATEAGVADRITALQGDADDLAQVVPADGADLVLCHNVLEMVDDPDRATRSIAAVTRPGGAVSVLVANRASAVLARALGGHLRLAREILDDPDGRAGTRDTLSRRFELSGITGLVEAAGLAVEQVHGVRVLADLVPGGSDTEGATADALRDFELATAARLPYRDIASQLHLLARRPVTED
ncbi:methyltransferase [Actinorhabdospora filicis]|uniref:Methyltransferase n=1 Tax=Actinorhabdospora filicis TaxID=1785913 RepID=A0A9W6W893_9ACTN|nr:methyltransferase domain-containing protein [Actinorhabdospora filicis]GLZ75425.1 methyltransferase [Actinorhabdospora filicis]